MILNKLLLHNVGTFAGRHVLNLTPSSPERPIVLIGGLNGSGKTTILAAIHLALYGPLAHAAGRRTGSYDAYLRGLVHRGVPTSEGAAVELTFTAHQEGVERVYTVNRSWRSTGASVREILLVKVDGRYDQALASTWNEHIETFLPRGIAGLFFFDGEQIEALADVDRSRQVLSSALAALLGLDLIDRLSTDLAVLRRRHHGAQIPADLRAAIEEKAQLVTVRRQDEEAAAEAEATRRTDVERCEKLLHEATEAYRTAGGDLLDHLEAAEARAERARSSLSRCEDEIRLELGEASPLLQLPFLVAQLLSQSETEALAAKEQVVVEALTSRDGSLLEYLKRANLDTDLLATTEHFLAQDRERRLSAIESGEAIVGHLDPSEVKGLASVVLPAARGRLTGLLQERRGLQEELEQAERVLGAMPDPEAIAPLRDRRQAAMDALVRAQASLDAASALLADARGHRAKAAAAHEDALDRVGRASLAADDDRRLVDHVERVRTTLEELRGAAARRHLGRISQHVLEALGLLLRKDRLIADLQINAETHEIQLTGADGLALSASDLSAGERQLLAVAMLWGLARAAGQPLPVVIDTPLGRLDGSHRHHLLERYFPNASHQVVLLSTDTEIDKDAYQRIAAQIGRSYRLTFDPSSNATSIDDGYFWE